MYKVLIDWEAVSGLKSKSFEYKNYGVASKKYLKMVGQISRHIALISGINRCEIQLRLDGAVVKTFMARSNS